MEELKHCPSCDFTKEDFENFKKRTDRTQDKWDFYRPVITRSNLSERYFVECLNCGMRVLFIDTKEEVIRLWNELPRKEI